VAMTEIDGYWRTRTIGEAEAQGYSHLRATCPGCERITDIPWQLLLQPPGITTDTFLGNLPLKCQRCGNTEQIIGVRHHGNTQGYAKP
jgi:phage FluMu protein Com